MLYLFAAVFGFGSGGGAALMSPMVAELFGLTSHGMLLGLITFGFTLGAAFGPLTAGYSFDIILSYQPAFLIIAFIGVAGLTLSALLRPVKFSHLSPEK